jgi:hypothetical protein
MTALSKETRTAVLPPPLCRDCRWCRPSWVMRLNFPMWWMPMLWRDFWRFATCRHPTSIYQYPTKDFITGAQGRPKRMDCNWARSSDRDNKCGPQARYWEARTYPAWLWPAGSTAAGFVLFVAYIALLYFGLWRVK